MSSKNFASDMVPAERTLLVIGSKDAVSVHKVIITYYNIKNKIFVQWNWKKTWYLNRVKDIIGLSVQPKQCKNKLWPVKLKPLKVYWEQQKNRISSLYFI